MITSSFLLRELDDILICHLIALWGVSGEQNGDNIYIVYYLFQNNYLMLRIFFYIASRSILTEHSIKTCRFNGTLHQ